MKKAEIPRQLYQIRVRLRACANARITDLAQLRKIGVAAPEQAAPYVPLDGRQQTAQLGLL